MRILAYLGVFVLALPVVVAAGRADDVTPEEGFVSLFNGKDLTGWTYKGSKENLDGKTSTADGRVVVEDGTIVMKEKDVNGKGGIKELTTRKVFAKSFHLKLEFNASLKSDSGVYVRGPQLQVRDFIRRNEQRHLKKFVNDGWNTLDIIVRDNQVITTVDNKLIGPKDEFSVTIKKGESTAKLNGKPIDAKSVQVRKASVAECLCNGEPLEIMLNIPAKGGIGLQAETGKFAFRRVRVKELE
jgi:Domain of Unknown Function (DUF1080)